MLSKFITPGCKIELQAVNRVNEEDKQSTKKVYTSKVYDIISEDRMEIAMPMEQTNLILLPVDGEYDLVFYGNNNNLYQCFARIIDRYKSNNSYILVVEMTSNLRKFQRREYYRFSCALEMCARPLVEEEVKAVEQKEAYFLTPGLPLKRSVIVDISGGGLRFMSDQQYEPESLIYCNYHLVSEKENTECEIVGKILSAKEIENKKGTYEHRVQYVNMGAGEREKIIKYIFEEERKNLRREKG